MESSLLGRIPPELFGIIARTAQLEELWSLAQVKIISENQAEKEVFNFLKSKWKLPSEYSPRIRYSLISDTLKLSGELEVSEFLEQVCQQLNKLCCSMTLEETRLVFSMSKTIPEATPALLLLLASMFLTLPNKQREIMFPFMLRDATMIFTKGNERKSYEYSAKKFRELCESLPKVIVQAIRRGLTWICYPKFPNVPIYALEILVLCRLTRLEKLDQRFVAIS